MKTTSFIITLSLLAILSLGNCKALARKAAKYWTKKQINEFLTNCENSAIGKFGESKGKDFCGCAVDVVAEQYQNYDEAKNINFAKILIAAKDCIK
jgi:hypothetical protein